MCLPFIDIKDKVYDTRPSSNGVGFSAEINILGYTIKMYYISQNDFKQPPKN